MTVICVFGDSIAWGANDSENGGWVTLLRNYLEPKDIEVYNLGVSGDNTEGVVKRFEEEAKIREANLVIFAVGINDSYYFNEDKKNNVDIEQFKKNLAKLVSLSKGLNVEVVFVGLTKVDESKVKPVPWKTEVSYDNENIKLYNSEIGKICKKNNLKFVSVIDLLDVDDLSDGLHPNSKGHGKMFERVKDFLLENIHV